MEERTRYLDNLITVVSKTVSTRAAGHFKKLKDLNNIYLYVADIAAKFKTYKRLTFKKYDNNNKPIVPNFKSVNILNAPENKFIGSGGLLIDRMCYLVWRHIIESVIEGNIVLLNESGTSYVCIEYLSKEVTMELYKDELYRPLVNYTLTKGRFPAMVVRVGNPAKKKAMKRQFMIILTPEYLDKLITKLESGFEYPRMAIV